MSTTETKEKILVWSKTEKAGQIVIVDRVEGEFTYFTDGSQVFTNVIPEVLIEAKDMADAERLSQPFNASVTDEPLNVAPGQTLKQTQPAGEVNVMLEMLRKLSAKNTITMPLNLNIPSQDVYELFKDQMDITKADLNEQILLLIMSQIDNLQEQLKPQAEEFINNYYNGRRNAKQPTGAAPDINF